MQNLTLNQDLFDDPYCGPWIRKGFEHLRSELGVAADIDDEPDSTSSSRAWLDDLCKQLTSGHLLAAVALLDAYAVDQGRTAVMSRLLPDTIRSIGAHWQSKRFSDGQATLAFATARHLIDIWHSRNASRHSAPSSPTRTLMVAVVPGDAHTFGAQVASDMLRLRGWNVETQLAIREPSQLLARLERSWYAAVLLSVGQDESLAGLADLVAEIRLKSANSRVFVLVGGSSLVQPLAQYNFIRADLVAGTAAHGAEFLEARLLQGSAGMRS